MPTQILQNYKIMLADNDARLGGILKSMMESMGFTNITFVNNGDKAYKTLKQEPYDFLVTESSLKGMSGLELISRVRRSSIIPNPSLPIIMLSGRAERHDITAARDSGMDEFVLKPFSANTLYQRLERLIERPRNFVVSAGFVGPDRRFASKPPEGVSERRTPRPAPQNRPKEPKGILPHDAKAQVWAADTSLRKKLGQGTSLSDIITADALQKAQLTIDNLSENSLAWIHESMTELKALCAQLESGEDLYTMLPINMSELALTVSTRAGTFGFHTASRVAYMLHNFCYDKLRIEKDTHHVILQKHLDALGVSLNDAVKKTESKGANMAVLQELKSMTQKLAV